MPPSFGPTSFGPTSSGPPGGPAAGTRSIGAPVIVAAVAVLVVVAIVAAMVLRKSDGGATATAPTPSGANPGAAPTSALVSTTTIRPWVTFTPPDHSFSVEFPTVAKATELPPGNGPYLSSHSAESNATDGTYLLLWMDLKPNLEFDAEPRLRSEADYSATIVEGPVEHAVFEPFAGMPSLTWDVTATDGSNNLQGFAMIVGARIYVFTIFTSGAKHLDLPRFRDSFHLAG